MWTVTIQDTYSTNKAHGTTLGTTEHDLLSLSLFGITTTHSSLANSREMQQQPF